MLELSRERVSLFIVSLKFVLQLLQDMSCIRVEVAGISPPLVHHRICSLLENTLKEGRWSLTHSEYLLLTADTKT